MLYEGMGCPVAGLMESLLEKDYSMIGLRCLGGLRMKTQGSGRGSSLPQLDLLIAFKLRIQFFVSALFLFQSRRTKTKPI